jgi:uncharacterized membrane protein HdeD (DUF308 family)
VDLFGIDADHRGGRRRWPSMAWPLLGGLVGALLGLLVAPPLLALLQADRLLPAVIVLIAGVTMIAFMFAGRRGQSAGCAPQARTGVGDSQDANAPHPPGG